MWKFKKYRLIITGDLNARIGTPVHEHYDYLVNPDNVINVNGKRLLGILDMWKDMIILNGLCYDDRKFDSDFTYFRGSLRSQNDIALTNVLDTVYSNHCPIALSVVVDLTTPLHIVYKCAKDIFSYDHLDINKRILPPLKIHRIDVRKAMEIMNESAEKLKEELLIKEKEPNTLTNLLSNNIYDSCKSTNKEKEDDITIDLPNLKNCNSKNFKAIANMNLETFNTYLNSGRTEEECIPYLENWTKFEHLANSTERNEINVHQNKSWRNAKSDSKKYWTLIDHYRRTFSGNNEVQC